MPSATPAQGVRLRSRLLPRPPDLLPLGDRPEARPPTLEESGAGGHQHRPVPLPKHLLVEPARAGPGDPVHQRVPVREPPVRRGLLRLPGGRRRERHLHLPERGGGSGPRTAGGSRPRTARPVCRISGPAGGTPSRCPRAVGCFWRFRCNRRRSCSTRVAGSVSPSPGRTGRTSATASRRRTRRGSASSRIPPGPGAASSRRSGRVSTVGDRRCELALVPANGTGHRIGAVPPTPGARRRSRRGTGSIRPSLAATAARRASSGPPDGSPSPRPSLRSPRTRARFRRGPSR